MVTDYFYHFKFLGTKLVKFEVRERRHMSTLPKTTLAITVDEFENKIYD